MNVLPLGVGGAFSERFFHNNYVFKVNNKKLLVDAGTTLRYSLKEAQLNITDIDYIFISHFHSDHSGGLEELLQRCYFRLENGEHSPYRPTLIMLESQKAQYDYILSAGLYNQSLSLTDYCHVLLIPDISQNERTFTIDTYRFEMIDTSELHVPQMQSFGLQVIEIPSQKNILFSGDIKNLSKSGYNERINDKTVAIFQDFSPLSNPVHTDLEEIKSYYDSSWYSKLYMMHYPDNMEDYHEQLSFYGMRWVEQGKWIKLHMD